MGCGSAKVATPTVAPDQPNVVMDDDQATLKNGTATAAAVKPVAVPKAVAFEVPLEPSTPGTTGPKSQPPERLQKQRVTESPPITAEALREKQAQAELRRHEV
ncbi:unnamed protein product, partial [Ixodes hexagonus]